MNLNIQIQHKLKSSSISIGYNKEIAVRPLLKHTIKHARSLRKSRQNAINQNESYEDISLLSGIMIGEAWYQASNTIRFLYPLRNLSIHNIRKLVAKPNKPRTANSKQQLKN